jgi:nitrate reductase NapAB chaperone NapD
LKIASLIIEYFDNKGEEVKNALLPYRNITIYGEKENKLVVVIESDEIGELTKTIENLSNISEIKNVIPVYISEE